MVPLLVTVAVLCIISAFAGRSFAARDRLPMQWGIGGRATWSLPKAWALAFTPLLAALCLAFALALSADSWALWVVGLLFVGVHLLHVALVARDVR